MLFAMTNAVLPRVLYQVEGSLCGYYNKAFAQRANVQVNFAAWNDKQTKSHGLFVEFGELQTTYRKEGEREEHCDTITMRPQIECCILCSLPSASHGPDLCCFDDFFLANKASSSRLRRKGIVRGIARVTLRRRLVLTSIPYLLPPLQRIARSRTFGTAHVCQGA